MATKKTAAKKSAAEKKSNFDKLLNTAFNTPAKKIKKQTYMTDDKLIGIGYHKASGKEYYIHPDFVDHQITLKNGKLHINVLENSSLTSAEITQMIFDKLPDA